MRFKIKVRDESTKHPMYNISSLAEPEMAQLAVMMPPMLAVAAMRFMPKSLQQ